MSGTSRPPSRADRRQSTRGTRAERAQSNLVTLVVALLAVSATTVLVLSVADGAIGRESRDVGDRRTAVALSERLVAPDGPLTARANVLDGDAVDRFDAATLESAYPVARQGAVTVELDDRTLAATGDPVGGTTIQRVVVVQRREAVTLTPTLSADNDHATTLPRRTPRVEVRIDPPAGTTVEAVRANGRVVLANRSGLDGTFTVRVSRFETTRLEFETDGPLPRGSVETTYFPARTTKSVLSVTVGGVDDG